MHELERPYVLSAAGMRAEAPAVPLGIVQVLGPSSADDAVFDAAEALWERSAGLVGLES